MNLLRGLGSNYNAVVTTINIRDDKISIESVHSMLLAFKHRLEQQSLINQISIMSVCYAYSSNNRGGGRKCNSSRGQSYTSNTSNNTYKGHGHRGRTNKVTAGNANLISDAKFCSNNNALIEFRSNSFMVKDLHKKKVLARGRLENGLYRFSPVHNKVELWHHILDSAATGIVVQVMKSCNVSFERNKTVVCSTVCPSCQLAKIHRLPS
ncbi:hypothetical protein POTOM_006437 [Populus tomentosa]|uniref:Uncharacterized protein n=1 Tax=Populus tomentosa TaxID=118781 RepID=A0A8X8AL01_POPTO|nr:hypothetical protein POTOM_006437 [Populus tomentosa]